MSTIGDAAPRVQVSTSATESLTSVQRQRVSEISAYEVSYRQELDRSLIRLRIVMLAALFVFLLTAGLVLLSVSASVRLALVPIVSSIVAGIFVSLVAYLRRRRAIEMSHLDFSELTPGIAEMAQALTAERRDARLTMSSADHTTESLVK